MFECLKTKTRPVTYHSQTVVKPKPEPKHFRDYCRHSIQNRSKNVWITFLILAVGGGAKNTVLSCYKSSDEDSDRSCSFAPKGPGKDTVICFCNHFLPNNRPNYKP